MATKPTDASNMPPTPPPLRVLSDADLDQITHAQVEAASEVGLHRIIAHLLLDSKVYRDSVKRCPMGLSDCPVSKVGPSLQPSLPRSKPAANDTKK